jgi:hypothetical protein
MDKLNKGVRVEMVSEDQMNPSERAQILDKKPSVDAIPDLDQLTGKVLEILSYLEAPETREQVRKNSNAVKMFLNNKYADTVPYGVISLLMEEDARQENVERLLRMFESLRKAKSGNASLEEEEKKLADDVNQRYIYSKYGSKEAFEKELAQGIKKEGKGGGVTVGGLGGMGGLGTGKAIIKK